jgi:hypothetical protein
MVTFVSHLTPHKTCIVETATLNKAMYKITIYDILTVLVRIQVLTAARVMTVFWHVVPCSLVEIDRRFRGAYCLHHQGDDGYV